MSEQRDLRADLREWNSDLINGIRSTDWFYLAGEYIERALKAEKKNIESYDLLYGAFDKVKDEAEQLKADNAALREENDLQRDSIQQLSAQVAAYRKVIIDCPIEAQDGCNCPDCKAVRNCENILYTQSNPGADLLAKIERLEAVAEAAKPIGICPNCDNNCRYCPIIDLQQALAALEGDAHE